MLKKIIIDFLKYKGYSRIKPVQNYKQDYSILNSKHYILEEKQDNDKILSLIQKLKPVNTDKELIRIGPNGDGGYLVPNDLLDIKACFSPGVSDVSGFENECYNLGMELFLADKSVDQAKLEVEHDFISKFIGSTNNNDFITMDEWVSQKINYSGDLLLQMDIEGAEYNSIMNMSNSLLNRFRILVIEFHDLHKLWNKFSFDFISNTFEKILQSHICVHIHPNNCSGIDLQENIAIPRVAEFTFLRKDRVNKITDKNSFPHHLDFDNTNKPHIILPDIWYK